MPKIIIIIYLPTYIHPLIIDAIYICPITLVNYVP
jgi:hypothetical protein